MKPNYPFIALVLGFGLWAALGYIDKTPLDPLIDLLKMGLGGLIVHMLKGMDAPGAPESAAPKVDAQAGFATVRAMILLMLTTLALCLAGCTTTTASIYKGLETQAVAGIKVFDDNALDTVKAILCGQPYSAIQRNPQYQPGVQALCGPLANTSSLDANQLAMLMSLLQSSGIKLQSAPAPAQTASAPTKP